MMKVSLSKRLVVARILSDKVAVDVERLKDVEAFNLVACDKYFLYPHVGLIRQPQTAQEFASHAPSVKVFGTNSDFANGKVGQLKDFFSQLAEDEVVLTMDADIDASTVNIQQMREKLVDPKTAAVYAATTPIGKSLSVGDFVLDAVLTSGLHSIPLMARLDPKCFAGAVLAVKASSLQSVGGWEAFKATLGEDIALAKALRQKNWSIQKVGDVARSTRRGQSLGEVWRRGLRWVSILKCQRPGAYISYPFVMSVTALGGLMVGAVLIFPDRLELSVSTILAVAAVRVGAALAAKRCSDVKINFFVLPLEILISDIFLLGVWLYSLMGRPTIWHGKRL